MCAKGNREGVGRREDGRSGRRRASRAASGEGVGGGAVGALSSIPSTLSRHGTLSPMRAKGDREGVDRREDIRGGRWRSLTWKGASTDGRHRGGIACGKLFATGRTSVIL
eukprot:Gb_20096 [translate_table: standard]